MRRFARSVLAVALLPIAGPAGHATGSEFLTAPYADATAHSSCFDGMGLLSRCTYSASADAATGEMEVALEAEPRDRGRVGLIPQGVAYSNVVATHTVPAPLDSLMYLITLHVDEASRGTETIVPGGLDFATLSLSVVIDHSACACGTSVERYLLAGGGDWPSTDPGLVRSIEDEDIIVAIPVLDPTGEPVQAGTVSIYVTVEARLGQYLMRDDLLDRSVARLDGRLESIEVIPPDPQAPLVKPFASANAERSCRSLTPGTNVTCRTAASAGSGRIEFDLSATSPVAGTAPGSGIATGRVLIDVDHAHPTPIRGAVYRVVLDVPSADAAASQASPQAPVCLYLTEEAQTCNRWDARIGAYARVPGPHCSTCTRYDYRTVVATDPWVPPTTRIDDHVVLVAWVATDSAEPLPDTQVELEVDGTAHLSNGSGIVRATMDARLSRVDVTTFT